MSGNSLKIKKLKAGKYVFKVRAYIDLGKSKTYGKWSKVNKTKVK